MLALLVAQPSALKPSQAHSAAARHRRVGICRGAPAAMQLPPPPSDDGNPMLAHLRKPIRQYEGGWADTVTRDGKKAPERFGTGPTPDVEDDPDDNWAFSMKLAAVAPPSGPPAVQYDAGLKTDAHGNFEGHTAAGDKVVTDGNVKNYRRASDRLKEVGRRREEATSSRLV